MTRSNNGYDGDYSKRGTDALFFFSQKFLDNRDNRPKNTCVSLEKLGFLSLS